jgi:lipopolysaccharide/colanic/teichoic acid biosynthesis glycosyltransferase
MISVVSACQEENAEFKIAGSNLDYIVGKTSVSILDDLPLIELKYNISNPLLKFIKGSFDYLLALVVLFFIYPFIYLIVTLSNKKTDFQKFILGVPKIFSGKISFVGPRDINLNKNLYLGKKGLTGLWYTENSEGKDAEKLDIYYAKNQNIWLDLEILGKTFNKMWGSSS